MIFFDKTNDYIGLDLSNTSCKVVQLRGIKNNKPRLITYGALSFKKPGLLDSDSEADRREIVKSIQYLLKTSKTTTKKAVVSLPGSAVFTSVINFPFMEEKEIGGALRWEAKHYIPAPLEEVKIVWDVIKRSKEENKTEIFCLAAPKFVIEKYLKITKEAGLELADIEIEPFSIIRTLPHQVPDTYLILDVGGLKTEITIISQNIPYLTKSLNIGGGSITSILTEVLDVDEEMAENFKKEYGIDPNKLKGTVPTRVKNILSQIIGEMKKILELYKNSEDIKNILLVGGTALLPSFPEYLAEELEMEVMMGVPWENIDYPPILEPKLKEIGPLFTVACGLALKNLPFFAKPLEMQKSTPF